MHDLSRRDAVKFAAAAGLTALTGAAARAAEDDQAEDKPACTDMWRAWATTEGLLTKLVVEGIYCDGGLGKVALLSPANPQGINPKILILVLKLATLPGVWPTKVIPIPARYVRLPYKGQYDSIEVHYPDGTVQAIATITDAGSGP
jgi:hypothetical protein